MPTLNVQNRTLFYGDNLPFLRGINSNAIRLIATDPPFNKGRDFHATPDSLATGAKFEDRWSWDKDVHQDWIDAIQGDWPAVWQVIEAIRAAAGETGSPFLKTKRKIAEPPGPKMSRAEIVQFLIDQNGMVYRGCDREFDDPLYLEHDHNTPRSKGGLNHISNRLLLCGPCNRIKSNRLTLSGLQAENQKRGRMAKGT